MATIWTIVSVLVPLVLAIGLSLLGLVPPEFRIARILTWIAFAILDIWTIWWLFVTVADQHTKSYTAVGVGSATILGLVSAMLFIGRREKLSSIAAAKPEQPPTTFAMNPRIYSRIVMPHVDGANALLSKARQTPSSASKSIRLEDGIAIAKRISAKSPDGFSAVIEEHEAEGVRGLKLTVSNDRLDGIHQVSITVSTAQSYDANYHDFRQAEVFKNGRIIQPEMISASTSGRATFIVRKRDIDPHLMIGDVVGSFLIWPHNDKSPYQTWRIPITVDAQTWPHVREKGAIQLSPIKLDLIVIWMRERNEFFVEPPKLLIQN